MQIALLYVSNTPLIVILYATECLLVLMINHCARLKVYLLSLIVQRFNCLSIDAIECLIHMQIGLLKVHSR